MRLFLAIDLPEPVRAELRAIVDRLRPESTGWRWARPEGVHLTMRFLGEVPDARVEREAVEWRRIAASCTPALLELAGMGAFPRSSRPRVLWVGVREIAPGEALQVLARRLEEGARSLAFSAEERAFSPHLTLARAERGGHRSMPAAVPVPALRLRADELTLFRSRLERGGARYEALQRFPLGGQG